jgi:hypothetical protein
MREQVGWFIVGIFYLAILYTLVRPGSKGPAIVQVMSATFADLIRGVAGQTYNPSTQQWSAGNG